MQAAAPALRGTARQEVTTAPSLVKATAPALTAGAVRAVKVTAWPTTTGLGAAETEMATAAGGGGAAGGTAATMAPARDRW